MPGCADQLLEDVTVGVDLLPGLTFDAELKCATLPFGSPGDVCGSYHATGQLATSGGTYTVTFCRRRVLARCG